MVKLAQILEQGTPSIKSSIQTIVKQCPKALDAFFIDGRYRLYRGIINPTPHPIDYKLTRTNRQPRDTLESIHQATDLWFLERFKHRYRSNATAATGNRQTAEKDYGTPHFIVPDGDFSFLWSPEMMDIGASVEEVVSGKLSLTDPRAITDQLIKELVYHFLDDKRFETKQPQRAVQSGNEIMIVTEGYYVVNLDRVNETDINTRIEREIRDGNV